MSLFTNNSNENEENFLFLHQQLIKILDEIGDKELKITIREVMKASALSVGGITLGAIVFGGPIGLIAGGLSGLFGYYYVSQDSRSLIAILKSLNEQQKQQLIHQLQIKCPQLISYLLLGEHGKQVIELIQSVDWDKILANL